MKEKVLPEETTEADGNGNKSQYEELLEDIKEKGFPVEANKLAGTSLLTGAPQRQAAVHYLATIGDASKVYKDNAMLSVVLDQMARTIYKSREERLAYLGYLEWVKENDQDYDYALWYITSAISEGGQSRIDLVAAVTTINQNIRSNAFSGNNNRKTSGSNPSASG